MRTPMHACIELSRVVEVAEGLALRATAAQKVAVEHLAAPQEARDAVSKAWLAFASVCPGPLLLP